MNKNVNVLMSPSLVNIKEYIQQHDNQIVKNTKGGAIFCINDSLKVGKIDMGSFLFDIFLNKKEEEHILDEQGFIYFFRTQYLSPSDIAVNYLSDFSEKYLIVLFIESDQAVVNFSQNEVQHFDKGPWVIFNTNDIAHQLCLPQNTHIKALSIFFSFKQLAHLFGENSEAKLHQLIAEEQSFFKYQVMNKIIKNTFDDALSRDLNTFIDQIGFQKDVFSLVHFVFTLIEDIFTPKSKRIKETDIKALKRIERLITNNIQIFPSIKSIASEAAMSETKLKTLFKEFYGMSIHNYYLAFRMNTAKNWIDDGQKSIKEVASELGYKNISHFSRMFKKHFGQYPSKI